MRAVCSSDLIYKFSRNVSCCFTQEHASTQVHQDCDPVHMSEINGGDGFL